MSSFGIMQAFNSWYGALIMISILLMSIYMVALIIVRWVYFRRMRADSDSLMQQAQKAYLDNDTKVLAELKNQKPTAPPVKLLIGLGLANSHLASQDLVEFFSITRVRIRERLTRGLSVFGTFAAIAPFIGLLGTVLGIVSCFNSLATSGASGPNVVASGVAEALWATAAGLFVAIPSVVSYNVFKNKAKDILTDLEIISRDLILLFKTEKKHASK
jgi:biopolymer transport protein ExbB